MPTPSPRNKLLPARGQYASLEAALQDLLEGEFIYATDQNRYYQITDGALEPVTVNPTELAAVVQTISAVDAKAEQNARDIALNSQNIVDEASARAAADAALQDQVDGLENYDDSALAARVTQNETDINSNAGSISSLNTQVIENIDDISSNASAISAETSARTTADQGLQDQIDALDFYDDTALAAQVSTNTGNISTNASAIAAVENTLLVKADLVEGQVPSSQLPAIAIAEFLGEVADEAAMLALSGELGDWCIRSDVSATYVITGSDPTQLGDWTELATPDSPVSSVNDQTGAVVLGAADVGAATAAQGDTADTALQPADNISELTNDAGYITAADVPAAPDVPTNTSDLTNDSGFITSADVPSNTSDLTNDSGFITSAGAPVQSVNGQTGDVTISTGSDITDNSQIGNGAGYITASGAPVQSVNGMTGDVSISTGTYVTDNSQIGNGAGYVNCSGASSCAPVQSVNGMTGDVSISTGTYVTDNSQIGNGAGYITTSWPNTEVGGPHSVAIRGQYVSALKGFGGIGCYISVASSDNFIYFGAMAGLERFHVTGAGSVYAAAGLRFALEEDNPDNYEDIDSPDNVQSRRYIGPTLDVKERILNFQSRIEAIEATDYVTTMDVLGIVPEPPVRSVNGQTGDVNISVPMVTDNTQIGNGAGYVTCSGASSCAPVQSVNGQTGNVWLSTGSDITDNSQIGNGRGYITNSISGGFTAGSISAGSYYGGQYSSLGLYGSNQITANTESNLGFIVNTNTAGWFPLVAQLNGTAKFYTRGDGYVTAVGPINSQGSNLTSDKKFKTNIQDASPQLDDVVALGFKLRTWNWNEAAPVADKDTRFLGLIAQEVEKICPGIVTDVERFVPGEEITPAELDEDGTVIEPASYEQIQDTYKVVKNDVLVMKLLGAVAELSQKNDELRARLDAAGL